MTIPFLVEGTSKLQQPLVLGLHGCCFRVLHQQDLDCNFALCSLCKWSTKVQYFLFFYAISEVNTKISGTNNSWHYKDLRLSIRFQSPKALVYGWVKIGNLRLKLTTTTCDLVWRSIVVSSGNKYRAVKLSHRLCNSKTVLACVVYSFHNKLKVITPTYVFCPHF